MLFLRSYRSCSTVADAVSDALRQMRTGASISSVVSCLYEISGFENPSKLAENSDYRKLCTKLFDEIDRLTIGKENLVKAVTFLNRIPLAHNRKTSTIEVFSRGFTHYLHELSLPETLVLLSTLTRSSYLDDYSLWVASKHLLKRLPLASPSELTLAIAALCRHPSALMSPDLFATHAASLSSAVSLEILKTAQPSPLTGLLFQNLDFPSLTFNDILELSRLLPVCPASALPGFADQALALRLPSDLLARLSRLAPYLGLSAQIDFTTLSAQGCADAFIGAAKSGETGLARQLELNLILKMGEINSETRAELRSVFLFPGLLKHKDSLQVLALHS